jgi:hypothetical protein
VKAANGTRQRRPPDRPVHGEDRAFAELPRADAAADSSEGSV